MLRPTATQHLRADQDLQYTPSLHYCPPEVVTAVMANNRVHTTRAHDVWAAGQLLFEGLAARPAFQPQAQDHIAACAQRRALYPWEAKETLPPAWPMVANVLRGCLSREPEGRPAAATVLHELQTLYAQCS